MIKVDRERKHLKNTAQPLRELLKSALSFYDDCKVEATNRKRKTPTDPHTQKRMRIANGGLHLDTTILKEHAKLNEVPPQPSARISAKS